MRMSREERAKQFLPFSAVKGLEEALERKREEMLREERIPLGEEGEKELDMRLRALREGDTVFVSYHDGCRYISTEDVVVDVSPSARVLRLGGCAVFFDDIRKLETRG